LIWKEKCTSSNSRYIFYKSVVAKIHSPDAR
jgi:hypothetical protein